MEAYMAVLRVEPVEVRTIGRVIATITGIDPTDGDLFVGYLQGTQYAMTPARWDNSGYYRDHDSICNLDLRSLEFQDLLKTARLIGALAA